ncbi:helix-turn-helix domain-containing protein [Christensenella timonensis]|uniref:helix-turn-helix domain-containing protein n=1 Tax=Christensenella timonensis TaxID=1816678 RepID=UPI000831B4D1|nr:helix-turn-helix transcriptional regulator [Christensenella timonensis]
MNISQAVRKRILQICKANGLSVNALSNQSGVTQSTVNNIVNGPTYNVGIATIKKLCDGVNMSIRDFFDCDLFDDVEPEVK